MCPPLAPSPQRRGRGGVQCAAEAMPASGASGLLNQLWIMPIFATRGIILVALVGGGSMALGSQPRWTVRPAVGTAVDVDVGLRDYMLRIYNYMASGLALTGIVAYVFAQSGYYQQLAHTPLIWLVMLAPLGMVIWLSYGINRMQASTAQARFWIFAAVMGLSLASI